MFKKLLYFILTLFIIIIFIPLLITRGFFLFEKDMGDDLLIKVYDTEVEKIVAMELEDYLIGVVAAEMPANYHLEALKAQAVAARTYAARHLKIFGGSGSQQYPGADICTDYRYSQAWISQEKMKDKWGFVPFFYLYNRISRAVEDTNGGVLIYNGRLIDAVYHSNAGGMTEDPYYVWSNRVSYLKSVKSPYDKEKKSNYSYNYTLDLKDVDRKLGTSLTELTAVRDKQRVELLSSSNDNLIKVLQKSNSGRIVAIKFGDKIIEGQELRKKLSLPSNLVEFEIKGKNLYCEVKGNGHGVGMSQAGADGLARHDYNYNEILLHYYQGVEIEKINHLAGYKTTPSGRY